MQETKIEDLVTDLEESVNLKKALDNFGYEQGKTYFIHAEVIEHKSTTFTKTIKPLPRNTNRAHRVVADAYTIYELLILISEVMGNIEKEFDNLNMDSVVQKAKDILNKK